MNRYLRFEQLYQVVSWVGTIGLALIVLLSHSVLPSQKPVLLVLAGLLGCMSLALANILPLRGEGMVAYRAEDKVLIESLVMIILLTGFLYVMPLTSSGFFLLLCPILIEATVLHERIILAEAVFAVIAITFLKMGSVGFGPIHEADFIIEIMIFFSIVALMYFLTRLLRKADDRNNELSAHLSERLDQIQIISMLVQQSEYFQQFDKLLGRIGEIIMDAFDVEQCGFFLDGPEDGFALHPASVGYEEHDRKMYALDENLSVIRRAFEQKMTLVANNEKEVEDLGFERLIGNRHLKNFIILPLGVSGRNLGLMMVANRRSGPFKPGDQHFLELLGGFISTLIDSANAFMRVEGEKRSSEKMARLLVGRELRMRELKNQLQAKHL